MNPSLKQPWSREAFEQRLRAKGAYYHIHHPLHIAMNRGQCTAEQIRGWVANRFYYQINIPIKDAAIMANCTDRDVRRQWIQRILDHDGREGEEGGIEAWLRLGEACGLSRQELIDQQHQFRRPFLEVLEKPAVKPGSLQAWEILASMASQIWPSRLTPSKRLISCRPVGEVTLISVR